MSRANPDRFYSRTRQSNHRASENKNDWVGAEDRGGEFFDSLLQCVALRGGKVTERLLRSIVDQARRDVGAAGARDRTLFWATAPWRGRLASNRASADFMDAFACESSGFCASPMHEFPNEGPQERIRWGDGRPMFGLGAKARSWR